MTAPDRLTAVFAGDSITDAGRLADPEGLGQGYVRLIAARIAAAGAPIDVVNAGIGGNRVVDLAARWQADVLDAAPDVLTVLIGVNDMWRRYDSDDPTSATAFEAGYSALLEAARRNDVRRLALMEPFLVPIDAEQERWRVEDLDEKIAVTRDLARRFDATLIELDPLLNAAAADAGPRAIAEDGVHPTEAGHELIARVWWDRVGARL